MISFPNRVWFETSNGWASREATNEDKSERAEKSAKWRESWGSTYPREASRVL